MPVSQGGSRGCTARTPYTEEDQSMSYTAAPDRYEHATFRRCGRFGLDLPAISLDRKSVV